ncbi:hypothetical protein [Burkholderia ubonensis]|uniref:hypothetical protein n=1 Tax=Burkholderia ubonensis TaxID=101571 RepID=UPI0012FCB676|nr:hypothetical protein [Burkholderia ubonensis]
MSIPEIGKAHIGVDPAGHGPGVALRDSLSVRDALADRMLVRTDTRSAVGCGPGIPSFYAADAKKKRAPFCRKPHARAPSRSHGRGSAPRHAFLQ